MASHRPVQNQKFIELILKYSSHSHSSSSAATSSLSNRVSAALSHNFFLKLIASITIKRSSLVRFFEKLKSIVLELTSFGKRSG